MTRFATKSIAFTSLLLVACASSASPTGETLGTQAQRDQWTPKEDPAALVPGASTRLADVITAADVGQTFGVDDAHVPYPDTFWPFVQEGTDANWNGDASPIEKLMAVTNPAQTADAKAWEHNNHGSAVPGVADWWGHCPGWTGAAMSNAPIQHAVFAKADGSGGVVACNQGDDGCVRFEIGDVNALEAEAWIDGPSSFIGARCDTAPNQIKRDADGRIVRDGTGCKGLNAGALVVVLANRMKQGHAALAIDAQTDFNTDQIWNQPAYRYTVYRYEALTESAAANLVATGARTGAETSYRWDDQAKGFAFVDIGIKWVTEQGPNTSVVSGTDSTKETRFVAVLELDGDPASGDSRILGGEYLDDASVGSDRLTVPPFVWVSQGAGSDDLDPSASSGDTHNPYVKPSVVKALVALGVQ